MKNAYHIFAISVSVILLLVAIRAHAEDVNAIAEECLTRNDCFTHGGTIYYDTGEAYSTGLRYLRPDVVDFPDGMPYIVCVKPPRGLSECNTIEAEFPDGAYHSRLRIPEIPCGEQRGGDANGDDCVTLVDFSILSTSFGKCEGMVGYRDEADFNCDACITLVDFSILATAFGQCGDAR